VPRSKTSEGKRVTICAKFSEEDAALIDARCAAKGQTRSAWLQSLAAADLAGVRDGGEVLGIRMRIDPKMPAGTAALVSPGKAGAVIIPVGAEPARKPVSHRCPVKGWCEECGEWKGAKR
jgi:hypothetical protein